MFGRRRAEKRTGTPADLLVVGLGNPGEKYEGTRHNMGAEVVAILAERNHERLRASKQAALVAEFQIAAQRVVIAFPQTFMNESGRAVRDLLSRHGIDEPTRLLVVHDEIDLDVGRVKLKEGGGLAGNNGLKSIKAHIKTDEFLRLRIGVGRPPGRRSVTDHVLRRPGKSDRIELDISVERAADAVESLVRDGVAKTMNELNR